MADIVPIGVDRTSGQARTLKAADNLTDDTGAPIMGLQGTTGVVGISGSTGTGVQGGTGVLGLVGNTGTGVQGGTGVLGLVGNTGSGGLVGATGASAGGGGSHTVLSSQVQASGTSLTFALPGNTLATDGDMIAITFTGANFTTPGNIQLSIGGGLFYNATQPTGNINIGGRFYLTRSGASQQRTIGWTGPAINSVGATRTANLAVSNDLVVNLLGSSGSGAIWTMTVELIEV